VNRSARLLSGSIAIAATSLVATCPVPAAAATAPVSGVRIIDRFNPAAGQLPENIALEPAGSIDLSFALAHEIARVGRDGSVTVLAALPAPADGGVNTPILGFAISTGLVRAQDGALYFGYAAGDASLTGIWTLRPGSASPERIAALPGNALPNGLALDPRTGTLYAADSALGVVWSVPATGGTATVWSAAPQLAPHGFLGANGIKVHDGAVWVSNTDQGTIIRIEVCGGAAGSVETRATGLSSVDDFAFTAGGRILAALNSINEVALVQPDGTHTIVLTAADGLANPTSVAVRGSTFYVPSADYANAKNPNLLSGTLDGR
jgi:hypothetical protein